MLFASNKARLGPWSPISREMTFGCGGPKVIRTPVSLGLCLASFSLEFWVGPALVRSCRVFACFTMTAKRKEQLHCSGKATERHPKACPCHGFSKSHTSNFPPPTLDPQKVGLKILGSRILTQPPAICFGQASLSDGIATLVKGDWSGPTKYKGKCVFIFPGWKNRVYIYPEIARESMVICFSGWDSWRN